MITKVLRQDLNFSTVLPNANKKIRELYYSMVNTSCISSEDMSTELQRLKGKTKIKSFQIISHYYDEMNYRM